MPNLWINIDTDEYAKQRKAKDRDAYIRERIAQYSDEGGEEAFRQGAREAWAREGEIEIDPGAIVSMGGDPGAYVMAWVWVSNEEAGIESEEEDEDDDA